MKNYETAIFGGGCFWCTEAIFKNLKGVVSVTPGYAGGVKAHPSYQEVSSGATQHAEVVRVEFDPDIIPYRDLLEVFWHTHNPTTFNRQGNDIGNQYRSIILYTTDNQKHEAQKSKENLERSGYYKDSIVTEIKPSDKFYPAESYHMDYYNNNSTQPYCQLVISPKLQHLREKYAGWVKK